MTGFRAVVMLVAIAALFLTFLPMLAITGLGDLNASNGYVPPTVAAPSGSATTAPPPPAGTGSIALTATSLAFDKTAFTVPAGPVTITFNNQEAGLPHNVNVFDGSSNSAKSLGNTNIQNGPNTQTLNVTLKAGTYYFQCDVHPTQMHGTITAT